MKKNYLYTLTLILIPAGGFLKKFWFECIALFDSLRNIV